jgi:S1-C subfamily serine protease
MRAFVLALVILTSGTAAAQARHRRSDEDVARDVRRSVVRVGDEASGVVVGRSGWIVTCQRAIEFSLRDVRVELASGTWRPAHVVAEDPEHGLALLELDGAPIITHPIAVGDSDSLAVGAPVRAVSGEDDAPASGMVVSLADAHGVPLLGTEIPVAHDMCGGALVDSRGRLVGVLDPTDGDDAVAVPSTRVTELLTRASAQPTSVPAPEATASHYVPRLGIIVRNLPTLEGVVVETIHAGSPAEHAGLSATPVGSTAMADLLRIIRVDGTPITAIVELEVLLRTYPAGAALTLTVRKGSDTRAVQVVLDPP